MLADNLAKLGYKVIGEENMDFLDQKPDENFDFILTNPPYTKKDAFLKRAYELGKPFAFLLPLTTLDSKFRRKLFATNGVEIVLLPNRVKFTTPSGKVGGAWFAVAWFCGNMKIGKQLVFPKED
jgi:23S rRNA G2445 N2-methylase RlmL